MAPAARVLVCVLVALGVHASALAGGHPMRPSPPALSPSPAPSQGPAQAPGWDERRIALPIVGSGAVYVPHAATPRVVIIVSDDATFGGLVVDIARHIAPRAVVIGIAGRPLLKRAALEGGCWYPAADLEFISHSAQKRLGLSQYRAPMLIGYGVGASVAYAAAAGGPAVTFAGVISINFCPTLAVGVAVCAGDQWVPEYNDRTRTNVLPPQRGLAKDWWILNFSGARACTAESVRRIAAGVPKAHVAEIPGTVGRLSRNTDWVAPLDTALLDLWAERDVKPAASQASSATTRELQDDLLGLQIPMELRWPAQLTSVLLFFSGDGGWASLDEETAEHLVTRGIGVVGVSSLRYFWAGRPPAQVAGDVRRIVTAIARSGRPVFVGGFSFGAEVMPVVLREWTPAERQTLGGLVLVGPGPSASFEIDPLDWIRRPDDNPQTRVAPAVRALGIPALCIGGTKEEDTPCASLGGVPGVRVVRLPGSHHFNGDYTAVADAIAQFIRTAPTERHP